MVTQGLLDSGDEILVPSPDYPLWTGCVSLAGGTPVHYICDEQSEWYPDIEDIKSKITDKTKAIVLINPNNPTGAVYPKELLMEIVEIAREHELMIFLMKFMTDWYSMGLNIRLLLLWHRMYFALL